jgi:hypothetical protein
MRDQRSNRRPGYQARNGQPQRNRRPFYQSAAPVDETLEKIRSAIRGRRVASMRQIAYTLGYRVATHPKASREAKQAAAIVRRNLNECLDLYVRLGKIKKAWGSIHQGYYSL